MALNANVVSMSRSEFALALFYSYVIRTLKILSEFQQTVIHIGRELTFLLDTPFKARLHLSHIGRDLILNQFHLFNNLHFTTSSEAEILNNNRRLDRPYVTPKRCSSRMMHPERTGGAMLG